MTRKILGGLCLALPFVALFIVVASRVGWQIPTVIYLSTAAAVAVILLGIRIIVGPMP